MVTMSIGIETLQQPVIRTRIKFCGLTHATDIDLACQLGIDYVGFVFYEKSPRFVRPEIAAGLRRQLPSWVQSVGLFVNAEPAVINQTCIAVGLDVIQFHGDETTATCAEIFYHNRAQYKTRAFWQAARIKSQSDLIPWCAMDNGLSDAPGTNQGSRPESLLLDSFSEAYGGTGHAFDWHWVATGASTRPRALNLIASGGLTPGNVVEAIEIIQPLAVDVSSGIQLGSDQRRKSPRLMTEFVTNVLSADARRKV